MRPIRTFNVTPALPQRLEALRNLAYNLHWDWDMETVELFRRLDADLWESSRYNPVLMLGTISQARLNEIAEDEGFLAQMDRAAQRLEDYLRDRTWYKKHRKAAVSGECYAYFSMEFGLTTCMPVYSGGLGVLAGDHLKSASDLGLPPGRSGPALPGRLLCSVPERRRLAAGALSDQRLLQHAPASGAGWRR
jgi:starch phosphorylase